MSQNLLHTAARLGFVALLATAASTISAATPKPPPTVCVDGVCTSTPVSSTSSRAIKYHPGSYVWVAAGGCDSGDGKGALLGYRVDQPCAKAQIKAFIQTPSFCNDPNIQGVQIMFHWRSWEGATRGDFAKGDAAFDDIIATAAACKKRLMLSMATTVFGGWGGPGNGSEVWPQYALDLMGGYAQFPAGYLGGHAKVWLPAVADELIRVYAHYGARYNGNPWVEIVTTPTESGVNTIDSAYSEAALFAQTKRIISALAASWPNTIVRLVANDGSDSGLRDLFAHLEGTGHGAVGGPDVWPGDITTADRVFAGRDVSGNAAYTDYRERMVWSVEVQWQSYNLCSIYGTGNAWNFCPPDKLNRPLWPLQKLWDATNIGYTPTRPLQGPNFAMPPMHPRYLIWFQNSSNGNSENQWSTSQQAFIDANPPGKAPAPHNIAVCPTSFATGCNTSQLLEPDLAIGRWDSLERAASGRSQERWMRESA